jgi:mevalonate pyrophosphate decarboxylase
MAESKPPFIKVEVDGHEMLINVNHIVSAHFKGKVHVVLTMVAGPTIKIPFSEQLLDQIISSVRG